MTNDGNTIPPRCKRSSEDVRYSVVELHCEELGCSHYRDATGGSVPHYYAPICLELQRANSDSKEFWRFYSDNLSR